MILAWWRMMRVNYGSQSMVDPLRRVLVKRPDQAFAVDDPARWHYVARPRLEIAQQEHDALVGILRQAGVEVIYHDELQTDRADAIFVHDPAIVTDQGTVVLRMGKALRRGEEAAIARCLEESGVPVYYELHGDACAEGGDLLWIGRRKTTPLRIPWRDRLKLLLLVFPYWLVRNMTFRAFFPHFSQFVRYAVEQLNATYYLINEAGGIGHFLPNYERMLKLGVKGYLESFEEKDEALHWAARIACEGLVDYSQRLAQEASLARARGDAEATVLRARADAREGALAALFPWMAVVATCCVFMAGLYLINLAVVGRPAPQDPATVALLAYARHQAWLQGAREGVVMLPTGEYQWVRRAEEEGNHGRT